MTVKELKKKLEEVDENKIIVLYDPSFENQHASIDELEEVDCLTYTDSEGDEVKASVLIFKY